MWQEAILGVQAGVARSGVSGGLMETPRGVRRGQGPAGARRRSAQGAGGGDGGPGVLRSGSSLHVRARPSAAGETRETRPRFP